MEIQTTTIATMDVPAGAGTGDAAPGAGTAPVPADALVIPQADPRCGVEVLDAIMMHMIREADGDTRVRGAEVRQHGRDAARMREKIGEHIRKQARQSSDASRRSGIAKIFSIIGAALVAAASLVSAPFTGGSSLVGGIATALAVAGAVSGGVAAGVGMASGMSNARAEQAGLREQQARGRLQDARGAADTSLDQARALVEYAEQLEGRVLRILEAEDRMASTAVGRVSC